MDFYLLRVMGINRLMMLVTTQVNDPVCQPDQQTAADNITDRDRNQVISDEAHHGQVKKLSGDEPTAVKTPV